MKNADYVGIEINGLKIVGYRCTKGASRRTYFTCICLCGKEFESRAEAIKNGMARSCGCKTSELMSAAHTLDGDFAAINIVYRRYKYTAKRKSIPFLLSSDQFKQFIFQDCSYCGAKPKLSIMKIGGNAGRKTVKQLTYNGIDRVDNNIGYTVSNCITCCSFCNGAKSDFSLEEFRIWIKQLVSFMNGRNNA
jgi:hypothetical protein